MGLLDSVVGDKTVINLNEVVGGGWTASQVHSFKPTSFGIQPIPTIVLVTLSKNTEERVVRLDLGKGMFLDPAPTTISPGAGSQVAQSVVANWPKQILR